MRTAMNQYDATAILKAFMQEIHKDKWILPFIIMFYFSMVFVLIPCALFWVFSMVMYADLPVTDHYMTFIAYKTPFVLVPFSFVLLFYFYSVYSEIDNKDKKVYRKARNFMLITMIIGCVPIFIAEYRLVWIALYSCVFITTLYFLSLSYLDRDTYSERVLLKSYDDLGVYGMMDNPISVQDDVNRARLTVATASTGFLFVTLFVKSFLKSLIYFLAICNKRYVFEAVRYLDEVFENNMEPLKPLQNHYVKSILSYKGYLEYSINGYVLTEKSRDLALKVKNNPYM
ncbi:hypothetical protein [Sulfurospirillum deleyianum]|nr:hypothetical protein [Sulfurospirillum deleyianum]